MSRGGSRGCGAVGTHTKKKRVQTWSETGQTQMLPCFCRSLEVMTAGGRGCCTGGTLPPWESQGSPQGAPTPLRPPSVSRHLHKARCSSGCGSGGSGTGWSGSAGRAAGVTAGAVSPSPPARGVPRPVTCGIVFIRLYLCTSSSFEGIRCCPFPIPAEENGGGCQTPAEMGTHGDTCHRWGRPLRVLPNPGNPPKVGAVALGA